MLQLIEVAGFLRGESLRSAVLLCVTLVTGPVLSTIQIRLVMQGYNERGFLDVFGYVLMLVHSIVVVAFWIISAAVFRIVGNGTVYDSVTIEKLVYIIPMSPLLYMTLITLTRTN